MNHHVQLKALLNKYRLEDDIPGDIKGYISSAQRRTLKVILQKEMKSAFFIACIVSLFMWAKRLGITLSLAKTAAVVTTVAVIGAGSVATGTVYTIHIAIVKPIIEHLNNKEDKSKNREIEKNQEQIRTGDITTIKKSSSPNIKSVDKKTYYTSGNYRIAVSDIDISVGSIDKARIQTQIIINNLNKVKGPRTAVYLKKSTLKSFPDKILFISIKKEASVYKIDAKIVQTTNSKILFNITKKASSLPQIDTQIKKITAIITTQL